ncbi:MULTISPECIES: TetR family transcriptional regulator [unclassified Streptomyces]|uniref:TetR family transcriptional regulator n=1 Tax=unclassified Streptomyces TaxID=2593676 RepID=UPI002E2CB3DF|nr:TetR family transcriptional regulator [Streptomyces sp. NBC_01423]WSX91389.1 TetR family transcriptional regulator [Streptomyces sp. NBC_00891]WSY05867.1 TetR family transcriptional regulator [Streptomyces sp. NBC_00890]WSZ07491.1 TetR family transcriptional regulator [Streptomyces sp. NBC_00869]WSZ25010.1 TetR family transcriptional regulator [Streptomyces sp. NBC_00870]
MNNAVAAPARPRGRPRGNPPIRESLVVAARALFLERGYRATTLRAVAGAAGVDPALISYHFGSKKGLFADVMQFQCASALSVDEVLGGDPATLPGRLIDAVTDLWEDADFRRLSTRGETAAEVVREYLEQELLGPLVEFLGGRDATARATAAVTVLGGIIYTRYLNPLPTPAALTPAGTRAALTPALAAALAPRRR